MTTDRCKMNPNALERKSFNRDIQSARIIDANIDNDTCYGNR